MSDLRGNLTRGDGKTLLEGRIWLGQERGKWPVHVLQHESEVIHFLGDPGSIVWEYEITPVQRVQAVRPAPFLVAHDDAGELEPLAGGTGES
jgi:hypothetical protein